MRESARKAVGEIERKKERKKERKTRMHTHTLYPHTIFSGAFVKRLPTDQHPRYQARLSARR